jgi:hypothetical protein
MRRFHGEPIDPITKRGLGTEYRSTVQLMGHDWIAKFQGSSETVGDRTGFGLPAMQP